ncbi:RNA polymerase I-specific transcription initiation factor RRN3-like [Tigriopus californicus]|uniref:RNA polymerase I-specific transcription initiation factor RRN3-like n=1 Tax=Tigriopus californicus TaxID=6832 RepID=UPI0027DA59E4|nr:RNA polymerase I-specific transcription initiation factor RRN3-like [Tigriopus californicus]|eukprot:TCALIF_07052-PA protein Name:"Similar to RRN3 RNA polymerase I-specific transcription initiation factor RRN3 (Homo sapiens)" AED:0.25 eAED:0.25 QI:0/-1/0/1/-1/1/1/0/601
MSAPTTPGGGVGILRRRSHEESPNRSASPRRSGVHFEPPPNLGEILVKYNQGGNNVIELEGFITHMRNQRGTALIAWLQSLQENIVHLKPKLEHFVLSTLHIPWIGQEKAVVSAFKHFLANLVSAHSFYTKPITQMLLRNFNSKAKSDEELDQEKLVFVNTHEALRGILAVAPLGAKQSILHYVKVTMPFMLIRIPSVHTKYIENIIHLTGYLGSEEERVAILRIVVDRLVQLDAYLPKMNEYEEEDDNEENEEELFPLERPAVTQLSDAEIARVNLDQAMVVMFQYITQRYESGDALPLYSDLLRVFELYILPTYATGHVQFLLFHFLTLDASRKFTVCFLDWLWRKFQSPNTPQIIRQSTIAYMASLMARGKHVDIDQAASYLEKIVAWIHAYIGARDGGAQSAHDYKYVDPKAHGPFYAACQSTFYLFAFRHQEFVQSEKWLVFLRGLNFSTIVTANLNPLRVCLPPVVKNFAAIARHYQLVYCDTIIERNNRINLPIVGGLSSLGTGEGKPVLLDSFFPFDPYMLKLSKEFVTSNYRVYQGAMIESDIEDSDEEDEGEPEDMDVTDILGSLPKTPSALHDQNVLNQFMYGSSPGFKV